MTDNKYDRRSFLLNILKTSGQVALASTAVYSVGLIVKSAVPSASMTAGAKSCGWFTDFAGNESACSFTDPAPSEPCGAGATWAGCTWGGSPGIYETKVCYCY